jgi:hypothetical protein
MSENERTTTAKDLVDYRKRWAMVNAVTDAEFRRTPVKERIRQFFYLMAQAKAFGWKTTTDKEIDLVRDRWRKLREGLGA